MRIRVQLLIRINNGDYQFAMISLEGWNQLEFVEAGNLHPVSQKCSVIRAKDNLSGEKIFVTLQLWKKGDKDFNDKELFPVEKINISNGDKIEILFKDGTVKNVNL